MPDYKRKKRRHFLPKPKVEKVRYKEKREKNKIELDDQYENKKSRGGFAVLKGKKLEIRRRLKTFGIVLLAIILTFTICEFAMPAGVFETVSTLFATLGNGAYPIELEGTSVNNLVVKSNHYYVLTDTEVKAISSGGKVIFSYTHGFENPVIKTSDTRALVFEQGGTDAVIFNLNEVCSNITSEKEIINAAIGADGTYALITAADSYVAAVNVYKKNDKLVYQWYSSSDLITNVAVAPRGNKIAISTMNSNVSGFNSKVMILNFKSANAEFSKEYKGELIYNLSSFSGEGVSVATANIHDFITWSKNESKEYKNEYNLQTLRENNNGILLVYNRENDKTDNRIVVISKKGEVKHELKFSGIITDIAYKNDHVYILSDTKAYIIDSKGKTIRTADCGFGGVYFAVVSQNEIAVITDNQITKVQFKQE